MDERALALFLSVDPDTLPYFVNDARTEDRVPVRFRGTAEPDAAELNGPDWSESVFREAWLELIKEARALKLVCADNADASVQGLVSVGRVLPGGGALRKSLLEAAPPNRHGAHPQRFCGVGRVLVARLVAESYRRGARGAVTVRARVGSEGFYRALGFRGSPYRPQAFTLYEAEALPLLRGVLLP